jgi:hypothetical protein
MRDPSRLVFVVLLGVSACSGAASTDLGVDAGALRDVTVPEVSNDVDASSPGADALASGDDDATVADASAVSEASTFDAGDVGEAGKAGGDAAGPPTLCSMLCDGCCDAEGKCRPGNTTAICGVMGGACEDCSKQKCSLTESGCCGAKGCGCAVAGILGCN